MVRDLEGKRVTEVMAYGDEVGREEMETEGE